MSFGYEGKRVVVTGGLGFIGSNLAIRLVELGAEVTIIDSCVPACGGNRHNIRPVADGVRVLEKDIAQAAQFRPLLAGCDVIFNLAGEISHIHGERFPERDAQLNAAAQLRFLQECVACAPRVRIVYSGTRQVFGVPLYLPVDERHPISPVDFNGIHNYAATMYHLLWSRSGRLDAVVLCLTNVYGPRMALDVPCQGVLNNFLRRLLLGQQLVVFGDGRQLRDPVYVDDAVQAFLLAGSAPQLGSRWYNIGGPEPLGLRRIAEIASQAAGVSPPVLQPFPPELQGIDIGSYYADWRLIQCELGWQPSVRFADGIGRALDYYRAELPHYLDPSNPDLPCKLAEREGAAV